VLILNNKSPTHLNMRHTFTALALATLSLASPLPDAAPATSAAAPSSFKIAGVISGGSGCPQGSINIDYTDSRILPICKSSLPTIYICYRSKLTNVSDFGNDFTAAVGPSVAPDQSRKNCQINIQLQYTPGYQYAVLGADYTGYGSLDAGVKGLVKANYYFSGYSNQVRFPKRPLLLRFIFLSTQGERTILTHKQVASAVGLQGPFTGRYAKHDDVALSIWSPCGSEAALNINSEVALTPMGGAASGTLVATKESARFTHTLNLAWRQC
jgi:hypothetical protein